MSELERYLGIRATSQQPLETPFVQSIREDADESGKIARHVIDDHYKSTWANLVETAGRVSGRRNGVLEAHLSKELSWKRQ